MLTPSKIADLWDCITSLTFFKIVGQKVSYIFFFILIKKEKKKLTQYSNQKIFFTDATSYALYKDFALDEIFTLDGDFKKIRVDTSF